MANISPTEKITLSVPPVGQQETSFRTSSITSSVVVRVTKKSNVCGPSYRDTKISIKMPHVAAPVSGPAAAKDSCMRLKVAELR